MAIDPRKRQKQLEKKAAKRKAVQAARKNEHQGALLFAARQLANVGKYPIHECLVPERLFELGIGTVIISRRLLNGDIAASFFLIDVYCLGVKFVFFGVMSEIEYQLKVAGLSGNEEHVAVDPSCARKLIEEAKAYAKQIGFDPHPDYHSGKKIFGDIEAGACSEEFTFGKDGKPYFISGPRDTLEKCKMIINTLTRKLGPDGFHFIIQGSRKVLERGFGGDPELPDPLQEWEE